MKRTSLTRRLAAGALSLAIGAVGAVALASPAQAFGGGYTSVKLSGEVVDCDPETGVSTIEWEVKNKKRLQATIVEPDPDVDGLADNQVIPGRGSATGTTTFEGSGTAELTIELKWAWQGWHGKWVAINKDDTAAVEVEDCRPDEEPPDEEPPDEEPIDIEVGLTRIVTCDFFVFIPQNDTEDEGTVTVDLTPSVTTVHGHAPDFLAFLDEDLEENGEIEVPEDAGLDVLGEIEAGETFTIELGSGDVHAHGFEASEDLTVAVSIAFEGEPLEDAQDEFSWADEAAGLDCEEPEGEAGGDELPVTGMSTGLIALGALALLALGGGLFLVARRRRVTFTA